MPKKTIIHQSENDRIFRREMRSLRASLHSYGVHDVNIGEWLGCTSQNVSAHWKNNSFSAFQVFVMQRHLKELEEENDY